MLSLDSWWTYESGDLDMKKIMAGGLNRLWTGLAQAAGAWSARPATGPRHVLVVRIGSLNRTTRLLGANSANFVIDQTRARIEAQLGDGQVFSAGRQPEDIRVLMLTGDQDAAADLAKRLGLSCRRMIVANGIGVLPEIEVACRQVEADDIDTAFAEAERSLPVAVPAAPLARRAADRPAGTVLFAPQTSCDTGRITGFRAMDAQLAAIPAPMGADETVQQVLRVLRRGLAALALWDRAGWDVGRVVVDLPLAVFEDPQFADFVGWELERSTVPAGRLSFELSEDISEHLLCIEAVAGLTRIATLGCGFDVTMANAGHWAGIMPRTAGRTRLAIDRTITHDCDGVLSQQTMLLSVVALADHYGWNIAASGANRSGEHFFLAQMGCHDIEGRAVAAPMALDETHGFLMERAARDTELPRLIA